MSKARGGIVSSGLRLVSDPQAARLKGLQIAGVALAALLLIIAAGGSTKAQAEPPPGSWYQPLNEEFSGETLNSALWTPEWPTDISGGCTKPSGVEQKSGYLWLWLREVGTTCVNGKGEILTRSTTGASINSNPLGSNRAPGMSGFQYRYGYVEWRAFYPESATSPSLSTCPIAGCVANWPTLWSFSQGQVDELDVAEGSSGGMICSTWHHWAGVNPNWGLCNNSTGGGWHTFGLDWEPGGLAFFYDGQLAYSVSKEGLSAEAQQFFPHDPQFLIASYQDRRTTNDPKIIPAVMKLDYVRVWRHPEAPTAATNVAAEVGTTSAKLTGWVTPNGSATNYYFEYGPTTAYGTNYPAPPGWSIGSGDSKGFAWNDIGGLQPGTTYHYRIVATNGVGAGYGADQTFTTQAPPPTVSSLTVSEATGTTAKLTGSVNPQGFATQYRFECGTGGTYAIFTPETGLSAGNQNVNVSATVEGLSPATGYQCRLTATNAGGRTDGPPVSFTTRNPPVVETLPPSEVTKSKITMAAKVDGKGKATTYYFEYGAKEGLGEGIAYSSKTEAKALPGGSGFQTVSASIEGLSVSRTIHYRIVASSEEGTVKGGDQVATTGWSSEPSSGPSGAKYDWMQDISCPASGNCFGVGAYVDSNGVKKIAAEHWNGSAWTSMEPGSPTGTAAELQGVSCPTTSSCFAVGYLETSGSSRPLIMKWNGSAWSEVSPGSEVPSGYKRTLTDLDCTSVSNCEAVGYIDTAPGSAPQKPLAMHWDGSTWTVRSSADPRTAGGEPSAEGNALLNVDCASATVCKAVGTHISSVAGVKARRPLIEQLSGSAWVNEAEEVDLYSREQNGETDFWLVGVSCPTTGMCFAVGGSASAHEVAKPRAFTVRLTENKWRPMWAPKETNGATELYDVSCSSPTSCRAVGLGGFAMHWMGIEWIGEGPTAPADMDRSQLSSVNLSGITCLSAGECHAVGTYLTTSNKMLRLTEGWSGAGTVPTVRKEVAGPIDRSTAGLNQWIDPAGVDTTFFYEYGLTESYGSKTPEASVGSGGLGINITNGGWAMASATASELLPGRKYHYRVVANNGFTPVTGPDYTFETKDPLSEMPVTEAFSGGTSAISDFATKWAPLSWAASPQASHKGKNSTGGWQGVDSAVSGAYFMPTVTDQGAGLAVQATLAGAGTQFSLWLDMPSPATAKSGYQMAFQSEGSGLYSVTLKKWVSGTATTLATKTGNSLPTGSRMALIDEGGALAVWTNPGGTGFDKILTATDSTYAGGNAGVEAAGSNVVFKQFKVGDLPEKASSFEAATKAVPVVDAFNREESPLSLGGSWAALAWDTASTKIGISHAAYGWGQPGQDNGITGAYWQKAPIGDTGTGDAVVTNNNFEFIFINAGNYLGLWLNAPSPGTVKSGYQLWISEAGTGGAVEVKLIKWVSGVATTLGTKSGLALKGTSGGITGVRFALVDKGGTVSAWTSTKTGTFTQVLSVADSTYSYGYAGMESTGFTRQREIKLGQLALY